MQKRDVRRDLNKCGRVRAGRDGAEGGRKQRKRGGLPRTTEAETDQEQRNQEDMQGSAGNGEGGGGGGGSEAYTRCVLSGVQSGRYLAPSSRALSRSSERKGFWKPLSTTTTPCRILPSSWGPARAPLGAALSPRGFSGTAFWAGVGAGAAAGARPGTGTGESENRFSWCPGAVHREAPAPSHRTRNEGPPASFLRPRPFLCDTQARVSAELRRNPVCLHLGLLRGGGPAEGLLGGFLSSRFKSGFLFPLGDS